MRGAASPAAISLVGVSKSFKIYHRRHTTLKETLLRRRRGVFELRPVLNQVDLEVPEGQSLGIIGRNGAGKSTMLKVVAGLMPPDSGTVTVRGRVSTLLELGAGFQGEYTGAENVYLYAALMGLGRKFVEERYDEIIEFSGIGDYIDNPVKTYSTGMYMRLAFAVAVHVDPEVLIIDEVLAVGDEAFQRKCLERATDLRERGKTIVLVSHDTEAVQRFCDRAIWLDGGVIRADGPPDEVCRAYSETVSPGALAPAPVLPVAVEDLRVTNLRGQPRDVLRSGDGATVTFTVLTEAVAVEARFGVRWLKPDGTCVLSAGSDEFGAQPLGPGVRRFACAFETLPLVADHYRVEVSVTGSDGAPLHAPAEPALVSVLGTQSEGVLAVPWQWSEVTQAEPRVDKDEC